MIQKETRVTMLKNLDVKIFADGAEKTWMLDMYTQPYIQGFTTNPTLMRQAGIRDYRLFAKDILHEIKGKPISFEVFSDGFNEMERQALEIASWGDNVYVKIPVTNTKQESSCALIKRLAAQQVKMNLTAIMTMRQVLEVSVCLAPEVPSFLSVFAGRIADTGLDPIPLMSNTIRHLKTTSPLAELIWASPRELLNIFQANAIGCHAITVTRDILKKLVLIDYDLDQFSLDTVQMFYKDALEAGYSL